MISNYFEGLLVLGSIGWDFYILLFILVFGGDEGM